MSGEVIRCVIVITKNKNTVHHKKLRKVFLSSYKFLKHLSTVCEIISKSLTNTFEEVQLYSSCVNARAAQEILKQKK